MASKQYNIIAVAAVLIAAVLPAVAMATEFTVGDESGWTTNFDYRGWANSKVFRVGDKLVFKYIAGQHNVFRVNGTAFANCDIPPPSEALTTGNDVITLSSPGRKWYICGVDDHCVSYSQKLAITVMGDPAAPGPSPSLYAPSTPAAGNGPAPSTRTAPAPAPAPSSAYGISVSGYLLLPAMVAAAFLI